MRTLSLLFLLAVPYVWADDWSRFRGPGGRGVSDDGTYPDTLAKDKNLLWRVAARPGKSSPVLTARHVFLTSSADGKLYTQCFDRKSGKLLWERGVDKASNEISNRLNHPAALSPVTDGENVYVLFKDFGMLSYDSQGKERWRVPLPPSRNIMGAGSSPVLTADAVVLINDQADDSYIAGYDKRNGELRWRIGREEADGWATPIVHKDWILTASRGQLGIHSAKDGKRIQTLRGLPAAIVSSPMVDGDVLYIHGYGNEEPLPFAPRLQRLDKNGDGKLSADEYGDDPFLVGIARYKGNRDLVISEDEWIEKQKEILSPNCLMAIELKATPRILWRHDKSFTSVIPSALHYRGVVYYVKNGGILTSVDAATGNIVKTGRVPGALGGYSSSPVAADGKVYLASEEGKIAVLKAGAEWEVLSVTSLDEPAYATPALAEGSVYLRTNDALYRFGK